MMQEKAIKNDIGMEFLKIIPSETIRMGDVRQHGVKDVFIQPFYIAKNLVTQKQWETVMGENPSKFKGDNLPVEMVSWNDAQRFLQRLRERDGRNYRLLTEEEWEYVARQPPMDPISSMAWFYENSDGKTHPVGTKAPSSLGIYDMFGNVWEWCNNKWRERYEGTDDPRDMHVVRGGGFLGFPEQVTPIHRYGHFSDYKHSDVGLRIGIDSDIQN